MKLLEKLRWLPTERLTPGTADVSGKSCVLATLVGETPGTSSARSRKLRPFSGRLADLGPRDRAGDLAARRLEHPGLGRDGDARFDADRPSARPAARTPRPPSASAACDVAKAVPRAR